MVSVWSARILMQKSLIILLPLLVLPQYGVCLCQCCELLVCLRAPHVPVWVVLQRQLVIGVL